jgi:hypothetical protein
MSPWAALREELDRWHDSGSVATFWWRDDDAADMTPELEILLRVAGALPLALAVIPGQATSNLADRLGHVATIAVLQHGWRHVNHAAYGRSEYPAERSDSDVLREFSEGRRILTDHFGSQAIPIFAPPWHGFDDRFLSLLKEGGLAGISRKGPRAAAFAAEGVAQVNAHVSAITWSVPPAFGGEDHFLRQLVDHLRGRRTGTYDAAEPTGLLTHHLVQDTASYIFITRLIEVTQKHPAGEWIDVRTALR